VPLSSVFAPPSVFFSLVDGCSAWPRSPACNASRGTTGWRTTVGTSRGLGSSMSGWAAGSSRGITGWRTTVGTSRGLGTWAGTPAAGPPHGRRSTRVSGSPSPQLGSARFASAPDRSDGMGPALRRALGLARSEESPSRGSSGGRFMSECSVSPCGRNIAGHPGSLPQCDRLSRVAMQNAKTVPARGS
jgi:hypothetical protein